MEKTQGWPYRWILQMLGDINAGHLNFLYLSVKCRWNMCSFCAKETLKRSCLIKGKYNKK